MNLLRLQVVLWKNLLIRRRYWFMTILEAFLPITLFLLVVYARSKIHGLNKVEVNTPTYSDPLEVDLNGLNVDSTHILYSPNTTYFKDIIHRTTVKFQIPGDRVHGFPTSEQLFQYYYNNNNDTVIAITFNGDNPTKFDYKLRYHDIAALSKEYLATSKLYKNFYQFEPKTAPDYYDNGFLALQKALDLSFMEKALNQDLDNNISLFIQEFPYPPHKVDPITIVLKELLPLITLFSFIFLCPAVLKRVVEEKHSGTKELMKMVGMKSWMLWLGWFVYGMLPILFSITVIVILLKVPIFHVEYPPIEYSDGTILFCFLLFYSMAALCSCFAISSCFSKPTMTVIVGILIWILSYFIPKSLIEDSVGFSWGTNMLLMLLPNMALHYGYSAIAPYEERELGIQWYNVGKSSSEGINEVTLLNVFLMLFVDIVFYLAFTMYMDGINPGKYGVKKPYLFPIHSLINLLKSKDRNTKVDFESVGLENVEDGQGLMKGIQIQNLVKRYGTKMAVNNLNLDVYQNQITVLLGHNGAGKSTTMSIITGMIEATSGIVKMNGFNIRSNMDRIRRTLGLCPQHNLLFPDLTVGQHLIFFAKLKGLSQKDSEDATNDLLKRLNMLDKKNEMADTLSGGMKRKLCLGMALIGGSKILILDEPSSGLDPESRRELWDLLLKWRGDKTILITTHFMEEADALGDWIAIMAEGTLQCYGTPMFLKKKYNTGYHLSLMVDGSITEEHKRSIDKHIKDYFEDAKINSENGNNIVYVLPEMNDEIIKLLTSLEVRKEELKLVNMSINATSLEDVFLKTRSEISSGVNDNENIDDAESKVGTSSMFILSKKKMWFIRSKLSVYLLPIIIAALFFIMTIMLSTNSSDYFSSNGPELKLRLSSYGPSLVYFNGTRSNSISELSKSYYRKIVESNSGNASDVDNVAAAILARGTENIIFYKQHMVVGAQFSISPSKIEATGLYNAIAIHSAPISLNLLTDTIAKSLLGSEYSISISNWPLENVNNDATVQDYSKEKVTLMWLVFVPIGCLFLLGSFIIYPQIEICSGFARQQYMCGVSSFTYWSVNFMSDFVIYFAEALLMVILVCISSDLFRGWHQFVSLMEILVMYGVCGIPLTYLFSRKKTASGAFALFIISMIFIGIILTVLIEVLLFSQMEYYVEMGENAKRWFVAFLPQVGLTHFGMEFARKAVENYNMDLPGKTPFLCYKAHPCCDRNSVECLKYRDLQPTSDLLLMWVGFAVYSLINILLDVYWMKKLYSKIVYPFLECWYGYERIDLKINETNGDRGRKLNRKVEKSLSAKDLKKNYSGAQIVKNINFTLENGNCLGILGVNGAGKTTTFRMLTLEEVVDGGRIELANKDKTITMNDSSQEYLKQLGYCPQNDALNYVLTGRQILSTIAALRGVEDARVVNGFLELFGLSQFADEPCGHYSGGNKRKLSLAVALIGYRQFVLLDEPTNGVDPSARRKCWSLIKQVQKNKRLSFILTSHSMTECEALCNDLKIMKGGVFHTQGSIAKLKSDYGGFSVKLKLATKNRTDSKQVDEVDSSARDEVDGLTSNQAVDTLDGVEGLKRVIMSNFEGEIKDEHAGLLHFYLKHDNRKWSDIFKQVNALKLQYPHLIEDYAISEASLEDVFLSVARMEDEKKPKSKGFFQSFMKR